MKFLKQLFLFLGGIIFAIFLLAATIYAGIYSVLHYLLEPSPVLIVVVVVLFTPVFLLWDKVRAVAVGMTFCFIICACWGIFVSNKALYENRTWEARRFPNRIGLHSKPQNARFIHVDTNTDMVDIAGQYELYYKKEGRIIATHPDFPGVQLSAEIQPDTYDLTFDFNLKRVTDRKPPFLMKYIK